MPDDPAHSGDDRQHERVAVIGLTVIGAIAFGVLGGLLMSVGEFFGLRGDWRAAAVPCGLLGAFVGAVGGWRWVRTRREAREAAWEMGFRSASKRLRVRITRRLQSMFTESISLTSVMGRSLRGVRVVLGVMSRTSNTGSSNTRSEQTIAWFESRKLDLPRFTLRPENSATSFVGAFVGLRDYDFDDSPVFSRRYQLSGDVEAPVRALFSPEVRDWFASHSDWEVMGHKSRLLLYHHREVVKADDLDDFVREAVRIFRLMARNVHFVQEYRAEHGPDTEQDRLAEALRMEGWAGRRVRSRIAQQFVTADDLSAVLAQAPPRELPEALANRFAVDLFLRFWSLGFMVAGLAGFMVSFFLWGQRPDQFIVAGLGIAFAAIGGLVRWLAGLSGRRALHLLTNGTTGVGLVLDVREASTVVNNRRQHQATIEFDFEGSICTSSIAIYGGDAMRVREAAENHTPVNLLYDPVNPRRILLTDLLTIGR